MHAGVYMHAHVYTVFVVVVHVQGSYPPGRTPHHRQLQCSRIWLRSGGRRAGQGAAGTETAEGEGSGEESGEESGGLREGGREKAREGG